MAAPWLAARGETLHRARRRQVVVLDEQEGLSTSPQLAQEPPVRLNIRADVDEFGTVGLAPSPRARLEACRRVGDDDSQLAYDAQEALELAA
jgi:hypothetical protein